MTLKGTSSEHKQTTLITPRDLLAQPSQAVVDTLGFLRDRRHLIAELVRSDLRDRYIAHTFGAVWHILHPLLLVLIYVMVFSYIFRANVHQDGNGDYITYAFSGLIPWLVVQEGLVRGAGSVTAQPYLARQADFPLEVLPIKTALGMLPTLATLTVAFIGLCAVRGIALPWTTWLLPVYWLLLFGFLIGMAYLLGSLAVFVPDVRDVLQVILSVGLFLSPILYLPGSEPTWVKPIFLANPFSYLILPHKDLVFYGATQNVYIWIALVALDVLVLAAGVRLFRRLKSSFAEAL